MWDAQREAWWISWGCSPPTTPSPPASRYSPCFLLVVPHSQYTISPVGQGLQGRGIFLHILLLHDIRMNICTSIRCGAHQLSDKTFIDSLKKTHCVLCIISPRVNSLIVKLRINLGKPGNNILYIARHPSIGRLNICWKNPEKSKKKLLDCSRCSVQKTGKRV